MTSCALVVKSQKYAMICIKLDIEHVVGVVSRYMSNHDKRH